MRVQRVEVALHEVVGNMSQHRAPVGHRVTAGVPLERARLEVLTADLDGVPHVGEAHVWHARDEVALVRDAVHPQVLPGVDQLCKRRVAYLGAAEVDDLHVVVGELECETDAAQHAQGAAKRVACHAELGLGVLIEHLLHLGCEGLLHRELICTLLKPYLTFIYRRLRRSAYCSLASRPFWRSYILSLLTVGSAHLLEERRLEHLVSHASRSTQCIGHIAIIVKVGHLSKVLFAKPTVHTDAWVVVGFVVGPEFRLEKVEVGQYIIGA